MKFKQIYISTKANNIILILIKRMIVDRKNELLIYVTDEPKGA